MGVNPLSQEQQKELSSQMVSRIHEAAIYLGVPEWCEIQYEGVQEHLFGKYLRRSTYSMQLFRSWENLFETANHTARVTLDSLVIAELLGFGIDSKYEGSGDVLAEAAKDHDIGKVYPNLRKIAEKKEEFTKEDKKNMKWHVLYSVVNADPRVKAVIADHHRWQPEPYTPFPAFSNWIKKTFRKRDLHVVRTPSTIVLSKFLGVLDYYDSAATRANTRNSDVLEVLSTERVKELMLQDYGRIKIKYSGEELPNLDMSGRELIEFLYDKGVFGRQNVFNPYSEPYSFIKRATPEETQKAVTRAIQRREEIDGKIENYTEQERIQKLLGVY